MGVIVIGLATPRSASENFECFCQHLGRPAKSLGVPVTSLGVPATLLAVPVTSLGSLQIIVAKSEKYNVLFGIAAGARGNHSYYLSFNDF
jgi:hypothetical protein